VSESQNHDALVPQKECDVVFSKIRKEVGSADFKSPLMEGLRILLNDPQIVMRQTIEPSDKPGINLGKLIS